MTIYASQLVDDSLTELGILPAGEASNAEDAALGFARLNNLIESRNLEGLFIYNIEDAIYLLTANTPSRTIGATGDYVATRPLRIEDANVIELTSSVTGTNGTTGSGDSILTSVGQDFVTAGVIAGRDLLYVISGAGVTAGIYKITAVTTTTLTLASNPGSSGSSISFRVIIQPTRSPLVIRDSEWWAAQYTRGIAGIPGNLYYRETYPNGILHLDTVSSNALGLELFTRQQLAAISALTSELSFPPGYYDWLMRDLALDLAAPFGKTSDLALMDRLEKNAAFARARVKTVNSRPPIMESNVPMGRLR